MDTFERVFRTLKYFPAIVWASVKGFVVFFIPLSWFAKDVSDEIVLITGAGSGLGREIALEYARLNSSLVLWDINLEGLKETKKLVENEHIKLQDDKQTTPFYKRFCLTYTVDVSDREIVYERAKQVQNDLERIDGPGRKYVSILVNNASIYHGLMFHELKDQQIERIFKINILAHFWTVRAFMPGMIKHKHGHIVEIASMAGMSGVMKQVDYCATKFATVGFEESLSIELAVMGLADKIRTSVVCPLYFESDLFTGFNSKAATIMSCNYVAQQAVMGMRCNYSRVLIPRSAYVMNLFRPLTSRQGIYLFLKMANLTEGLRNVKGGAIGDLKV
jgi:all-trans-retinol dehydrogenase (NAD+)